MWWKLRGKGILGMNQRNSDFIMKYNPRSKYPLVDDKLLTKNLAIKVGMPVPELYKAVFYQYQIKSIFKDLAKRESFVIKPSRGSGGEGILVVSSKAKTGWRKSDSSIITEREITDHISSTLSGVFSLGGLPDKALIEYKVEFDPVFEEVSYQGVPDIRVIIFMGIPVMAMLRLPTKVSSGKANLHQGAVGVGVDILTGVTSGGVWFDSKVDEHPDTGHPLVGLAVPHWQDILSHAAKTYEITGLGYQGVDFVLDRDKGPMLLEVNARPGLAIQIANRKGLLPRLKQVEKEVVIGELSIKDRVGFVKNLI